MFILKVIFKDTNFGVFQVVSAGSTSGGPAGVTLSLYQDNKKLNETKSKIDGT